MSTFQTRTDFLLLGPFFETKGKTIPVKEPKENGNLIRLGIFGGTITKQEYLIFGRLNFRTKNQMKISCRNPGQI